MYICDKFKQLVEFDFKFNWYYFFTIKHNHTVALYDNAHDLCALVEYVKHIMLTSAINEATYCFELDSQYRLHCHGIVTSPMPIRYKRLYREWSVTHHFNEIRVINTTTKKYRAELAGIVDQRCHDGGIIIDYITKKPVGPIIKSVKSLNVKNRSIIIDTYAYW